MENFDLEVFNKIAGDNRSELLLKSFHLQRAAEITKFKNIKNETMCKKCLTFWTNGEFTVELKKPKHKRRLRKKFLIEKYSRQFKEEQNPKKIKTLKKILRRMNRQNNQVAVYTCLLCKHKTDVIFFKPVPPKPEKLQISESVLEEPTKEPKKQIDEKTKTKKKNKKREKSSGLTIPTQKKSVLPGTSNPNPHQKSFNQKNQMLKIAEMLKAKKSDLSDKLKQLLK